jgi:hypothetical protein
MFYVLRENFFHVDISFIGQVACKDSFDVSTSLG